MKVASLMLAWQSSLQEVHVSLGSRSRPPRRAKARTGRRPLALPPFELKWFDVLGGALALSLLVSWILQFPTHVCDANPALSLWLAALNSLMAVVLAVEAYRHSFYPLYAIAAAALVLLGGGGVYWARAAFDSALDGAPGYSLPHRPMVYGAGAQEVTLTTADGVTLHATHLGRGEGPGLVLMPGWASNRHGFAIASLAQWLAPRFDVLVVDPRGVGQSGGIMTSDLKAKYDWLAAVAYLNAHGCSQVGVLAERESALSALVALGEQHNVRSLILSAPAPRWGAPIYEGGWYRDPANAVGRLFWRLGGGVRIQGGKGPETAELLPKASGSPILLLGSKDDPKGVLRQLHSIAPEPRSLRLFSGAGQPIAWGDFQSYYHTVSQWFELTLAEQEAMGAKDSFGTPLATDSLPAALVQPLETEEAATTP